MTTLLEGLTLASQGFLPFRCSDCDGQVWLDESLIAGLVDAGMCPYCETGMLPAMLQNPTVTKTKFQPSETRLHGATVIGRCLIKGRVGASIGLVLVDDDDEKFFVYLAGDRYITFDETPAATEEPDGQQEEEAARKKEAAKKGGDKK